MATLIQQLGMVILDFAVIVAGIFLITKFVKPHSGKKKNKEADTKNAA